MTDIAENTEIAPVEPTEAAKPEKAPKVVKLPEACACSRFLLADDKDVKEGEESPLFDTECTSTTLRTFAQGHDARLVSFLVNGENDGLTVLENRNGVHVRYDGAAHAAGSISEALAAKADAAIARLKVAQSEKDARLAKLAEARELKASEKAIKQADAARAKAEKKAAAEEAKAAKASAPKDVPVNVVPGSQTGDVPNGLIKIKVGRGEYDATVDEVDGKKVVTYTNLRGETETRDLDLVRVLTPTA